MSDRCVSSLPRTSAVSLVSRSSSCVLCERVSRKSWKVRAMIFDGTCDAAKGDGLDSGLRCEVAAWIERAENSLTARILLRHQGAFFIV